MIKEKEAHKKQVDPAFFETQEVPPFKWSRFVHNKKEGTYFGRTPNSWGKTFRNEKPMTENDLLLNERAEEMRKKL